MTYTRKYLLSNIRRKFSKLPPIFLGIIFVGFILFFLRSSLPKKFLENLVIKRVIVEGNAKFTDAKNIKTVVEANVLGKNIVLLNKKELIAMFLGTFPSIKVLSVKRVYPDSIYVNFVERKEAALVKKEGSEVTYLVDDEGFVLGEVKPPFLNLPLVLYRGDGDITNGGFVPGNYLSVPLLIVKIMEEEDINMTFLRIENDSYVEALIKGDIKVYISLKKDVFSQISLLKEVIKRQDQNEIVLKKIDLRYDNVVVE